MHGCHIAALKTQLHAAMEPGGALAAASPSAGDHSGATAAEGFKKTIAELRAVVEDKAREACAAAAHVRALEQDKAQAERWAFTSYKVIVLVKRCPMYAWQGVAILLCDNVGLLAL